jgi:hypothetical protein
MKKAFFQSLSEVFVILVVEKIRSASVKVDSTPTFPLVKISPVVGDQVFDVRSLGVCSFRPKIDNCVSRHAITHFLAVLFTMDFYNINEILHNSK